MRIKIKRSIICEGGIGTMKTYRGLGRARGLGEESMAIQAAFSAGVHNVKKIIGHLERQANEAGNGICSLLRVGFCLLKGQIHTLLRSRQGYGRLAA